MGFLEKLVEKKLINRYQVNEIIEKAKEMDIDRVLELYNIPASEVRAAKSAFFRVPEIMLPEVLQPELLQIIPLDAARNYKVIPIQEVDGILKIGMLDPDNLEAKNALQFIAARTNTPFEAYVISYDDFNRAIGLYSGSDSLEIDEQKNSSYVVTDQISDLESDAGESEENEEGISFNQSFDTEVSKTNKNKIVEDAPATKMIAVVLKNAVEGGASDVHIEPTGSDVRIRYRVDGILHVSLRANKKMLDSLIARLKTLTNTMKLDEKRKPQDGRFMAMMAGRKIDFRLSILPTFFGEKAVIRILDSARGVKKLDEIGMSEKHLQMVRRALGLPYGLILITGPTGSGKTTTLYSMLNEIDRERLNVISLEDPVEYNIPGMNQSQVRPEIGYTFANGLRSILRQDPDVIMVGEIRDKETAELAINAALTGHLVLATLHTNNSIGVIPRLVDMGVDPYLIAPTLVLSIAQRLSQTFVSGKGTPSPINGSVATMLQKQFEDLPNQFKPKITVQDKIYEIPKTGGEVVLRGRIPVFEMFAVDKPLQEIILHNPTENAVYEYVRNQGMLTMREDAIMKCLKGIIPWSEVNML